MATLGVIVPVCARHYGHLTSQLSGRLCHGLYQVGMQHNRGRNLMRCLVDQSANKNCVQLPPARSLVTHPSPSTSPRSALPLPIICLKPIPFPSDAFPSLTGLRFLISIPNFWPQFLPRSMTAPGDCHVRDQSPSRAHGRARRARADHHRPANGRHGPHSSDARSQPLLGSLRTTTFCRLLSVSFHTRVRRNVCG